MKMFDVLFYVYLKAQHLLKPNLKFHGHLWLGRGLFELCFFHFSAVGGFKLPLSESLFGCYCFTSCKVIGEVWINYEFLFAAYAITSCRPSCPLYLPFHLMVSCTKKWRDIHYFEIILNLFVQREQIWLSNSSLFNFFPPVSLTRPL